MHLAAHQPINPKPHPLLYAWTASCRHLGSNPTALEDPGTLHTKSHLCCMIGGLRWVQADSSNWHHALGTSAATIQTSTCNNSSTLLSAAVHHLACTLSCTSHVTSHPDVVNQARASAEPRDAASACQVNTAMPAAKAVCIFSTWALMPPSIRQCRGGRGTVGVVLNTPVAVL